MEFQYSEHSMSVSNHGTLGELRDDDGDCLE